MRNEENRTKSKKKTDWKKREKRKERRKDNNEAEETENETWWNNPQYLNVDEMTEKKVTKKISFAGTCSVSGEVTARDSVLSAVPASALNLVWACPADSVLRQHDHGYN